MDYMVIHDCNYLPDHNIFGKTLDPMVPKARLMGRREYNDLFKYWIEFFVTRWGRHDPPTLIGSNKLDLRGFKVRGMTICGKRIKV